MSVPNASTGFQFNKGLLTVCAILLFSLATAPAEAGNRKSGGSTTTSSTIRLNSQPASITLDSGASTTLSMSARSRRTITYSWFKNGATIGGNSKTLSISNASIADAGNYSCRAYDGISTIDCTAFSVSVNAPVIPTSDLSLNSQPVSTTLYEGKSVTFAVQASSSSAFTYSWLRNGSEIGTGSTLAINNITATDAGTYSCRVSDSIQTINCNPFSLTVNKIVRITQQPVSQMIDEGANTALSISATGTAPINYQWFYNGSPVANATTSTLTFSNALPSQNGSYYCVVSNSGSSVTTNSASLSVVAAVQTGAALISWIAPTTRTDGSALNSTEIASYDLYHAAGSSTNLSKLVSLNANELSVVINELNPGDHYFALATRDTSGLASTMSATFLVTIQ